MINITEFTKRLQKVIDFYGETASGFAEKVGVQRSSISHILSGRNKPSLDFVMKVLHTYPEIELHWLLNGKGNFQSQDKISETPTPKFEFPKTELKQKPQTQETNQGVNQNVNSDIEKIVIFYKNGVFKSYKP